jgi:hypothetical protein
MNDALNEGVRLFNTQKYFEAHEALEVVWLCARGDEKTFLHGLIQIAAAFHHHARGNSAGFRSLLEKGWKKLETSGARREGIDVAGLRKQLQHWRDFQRGISEPPPIPQITTAQRN